MPEHDSAGAVHTRTIVAAIDDAERHLNGRVARAKDLSARVGIVQLDTASGSRYRLHNMNADAQRVCHDHDGVLVSVTWPTGDGVAAKEVMCHPLH